MSKKILLLILLVFLGISFLGVISYAKTFITIGTSSMTATPYAVGNAMANILNNNFSDKNYHFSAIETGGSARNVSLIKEGEIDIALVGADVADAAYYGIDNFEGKPNKKLCAVGGLYPKIFQPVAKEDINSIKDVIGKKVTVGKAGSGSDFISKTILSLYNITYKDIEPIYMSGSSAAEMLKDGHADVMFYTTGIPASPVTEVFSSRIGSDFHILKLESEKIEELTKKCKYWNPFDIPANTYKGQDELIKSVAVYQLLVYSDRIPENVAYEITKILYEHKNEIIASHKAMKFFGFDIVKVSSIPYHAGALDYFKEVGIDID